jgi:hypothetical protein
LFENGTLFIDSFNGGKVFSFTQAGGLVAVSNGNLGSLDGLERDGANLLVTDFAGRLISIDAAGDGAVLFDGTAQFDSAADLAFDPVRRIAAIPELGGTEVNFIDLDDL